MHIVFDFLKSRKLKNILWIRPAEHAQDTVVYWGQQHLTAQTDEVLTFHSWAAWAILRLMKPWYSAPTDTRGLQWIMSLWENKKGSGAAPGCFCESPASHPLQRSYVSFDRVYTTVVYGSFICGVSLGCCWVAQDSPPELKLCKSNFQTREV